MFGEALEWHLNLIYFPSSVLFQTGMTCSLENVLSDAKSLVERLRNHDNAAEVLIEQTTSLNKRVEAMKQVMPMTLVVQLF